MLDVLIGLMVGLGAAVPTTRAILRRRTVDYRKRWLEALNALDQAESPLGDERPNRAASEGEIRAVRQMASWDRRDIEIDRARRGLPPRDDLTGMASWDVADVLKARNKQERSC